ncbi:MAG: hypothetical protein AB4911_12170 [Oscillochloridaceae bacterium umkhey_bin13]
MNTLLLSLILIAGAMFLWMIAWGVFWFLVQTGVIVQKALEPPVSDQGTYSLEQGREVKSEQQK